MLRRRKKNKTSDPEEKKTTELAVPTWKRLPKKLALTSLPSLLRELIAAQIF